MGDGTLAYKNKLERDAGLAVNQSMSGADLAFAIAVKKANLTANTAGHDGARLEQLNLEQALAPEVTGVVTNAATGVATGAAAGGTTMTVLGKNFTGATSVNIGGTNCTAFAVVSDTKITCTSAAKGAGTYDVNVVHPTLGTGTARNAYVYT